MLQFTVDGGAMSRGFERRLRINMKSNWNLNYYPLAGSRIPDAWSDPVEI
jgi:hypothetical protein